MATATTYPFTADGLDKLATKVDQIADFVHFVPPPAVVTVAAVANAAEGGASGIFRLTRDGGDLSQSLIVSFAVGGTATPGSDFAPFGSSIAFPPGSTVVDVPVPVIDDTLVESAETVTLTVTSAEGYLAGEPATASLDITDNDVAPPPPVVPPPPPHDPDHAAMDALVTRENADLFVPAGTVKELSGNVDLDTIRVEGALRILKGTTLDVFNWVGPLGNLEIGSESDPIPFSDPVLIRFKNLPLDPATDPTFLGRGLVWHGRTRIYGEPCRLYTGEELNAMTRAELDAALNRSITFTSADPAALAHLMWMHNSDVKIHYAASVVTGRTKKAIPVTDPVLDPALQLPGRPDLANVRGRYNWHFHHMVLLNPPVEMVGCVATDGDGLGVVVHDSNIHCDDLVCARIKGTGFFTESGGEGGYLKNYTGLDIDGVSVSNFTDHTRGGKTHDDYGFGGHGIWIQGGGSLKIDGAYINRCRGVQIVFNGDRPNYHVPLASLDPVDFADLKKMTKDQFYNRYIYAAGEISANDIPIRVQNVRCGPDPFKAGEPNYPGLEPWNIQNPGFHPYRSYVTDCIFEGRGIVSGYNDRCDYRGHTFIGPTAKPYTGTAFAHTGELFDHLYEDCTATGFGVGIAIPSDGVNRVHRCTLGNAVNIYIQNKPKLAGGNRLKAREIDLDDVTFLPIADPVPQQTVWGEKLLPGRWHVYYDAAMVWLNVRALERATVVDPNWRRYWGWDGVWPRDDIRINGEYFFPPEWGRGFVVPFGMLPAQYRLKADGTPKTIGEVRDEYGWCAWGREPSDSQDIRPFYHGIFSPTPIVIVSSPPVPS